MDGSRPDDVPADGEPAAREDGARRSASPDAVACPGCSAPLIGRACKLRCPRCGYFEDCSNLI